MPKNIGPSFAGELKAAGLLDLRFAWNSDGEMNLDQLSENEKAAVMAVYDAHNPVSDPVEVPPSVQIAQLLVAKGVMTEDEMATMNLYQT